MLKNFNIFINKENKHIVSILALNHKGGKILPYVCCLTEVSC